MPVYKLIPLNDNPQLLEEGIRIIHVAFAWPDNPAEKAMMPFGVTEAFHQSVFASVLQVVANPVNADRVFYTGVVDAETGELVGLTCWRLKDATWRQRQKDAAPQEPVEHPDCNVEATDAFHSMLDEAEERTMGERDYWHCSVMVTKPGHERKGVGRVGMQWGIARARSDSLDIHLQATPAGRPLYEKLGFEAVEESLFDCRRFGVDVDHYVNVTMLLRATQSI